MTDEDREEVRQMIEAFVPLAYPRIDLRPLIEQLKDAYGIKEESE